MIWYWACALYFNFFLRLIYDYKRPFPCISHELPNHDIDRTMILTEPQYWPNHDIGRTTILIPGQKFHSAACSNQFQQAHGIQESVVLRFLSEADAVFSSSPPPESCKPSLWPLSYNTQPRPDFNYYTRFTWRPQNLLVSLFVLLMPNNYNHPFL